MSQNTQSKQVNLTLPTLHFNQMQDSILLKEKEDLKKDFIQNINIQYSSKAENRASFADDLF